MGDGRRQCKFFWEKLCCLSVQAGLKITWYMKKNVSSVRLGDWGKNIPMYHLLDYVDITNETNIRLVVLQIQFHEDRNFPDIMRLCRIRKKHACHKKLQRGSFKTSSLESDLMHYIFLQWAV